MKRLLIFALLVVACVATMGAGFRTGSRWGSGIGPGFAPMQRGAVISTTIPEADSGALWVLASSTVPFAARVSHQMLVYNDKMWIIGGSNGGGMLADVWYSVDGIAWTAATTNAAFSGRQYHASMVYDDKMWVIAGYTSGYANSVYSSTDGVTWSVVSASPAFSSRVYPMCCVHEGKMWIGGGKTPSDMLNDVWYSTNGSAWTCATTTAWLSVPGVGYAGMQSFGGKMWVFGGQRFNVGGILSEVYSSADGVAWTLAATAPAFGNRTKHASVVYGKKMWAISGISDAGMNASIHASTDGSTWSVATTTAMFGARAGSKAVVYNNHIWVTCGDSTNVGGYLANVWRSY